MSDHIGIAMRPNENGIYDIYLDETGNLAMVTGAEAVGQHARQRLMTFEGEWFYDNQAGVPWLNDVMGLQFNPALASALIKAEIAGTDGVTDIAEFSVEFSESRRELTAIRVSVLTTYDAEQVFI